MVTTWAVQLKNNRVYCRGLIHSNQKFEPTASEVQSLPRGSIRYAVNTIQNIISVGWLDYKEVNLIST